MKKALLIALLLTGCTRYKAITEGATDSHVPVRIVDPNQETFLLSGQSNMLLFYTHALEEFRREYLRLHPRKKLDFVLCAQGGTLSSFWVPGEGGFEGCIEAARGKYVTQVIHMQGESDAYNSLTYWALNFIRTVMGYRQHFGKIPITIFQIARAQGDWLRGWAVVQQLQACFRADGVRMMRTEDLVYDEDIEDEVHLKPAALYRIAQRAARFVR